jgi:hypothetical protein
MWNEASCKIACNACKLFTMQVERKNKNLKVSFVVLWVMMLSDLVGGYQHFGGMY